ncbi:cytochrome b/b6 domain-containing protein [Streptomyces sp. NPDC048590]|uniref:cytochrome b/b6 domain-containing protein n=1 Tax=Streptomyces sp. NPDC048590 TaxID=3365574 RepID=UPI0037241E61
MSPLPDTEQPTPDRHEDRIRRFTRAEHWIHRTTAALLGTAIATAAFLYLPPLSELVGRRPLLVFLHKWSGILTPLPVLAGLASRAFRADLTRLNRFTEHDRGWIRATLRRQDPPAGKFNAGQKLYAAGTAGAVLVMIGTGVVKWFTELTSLTVRIGATFVHDWLALLLGILVLGHIRMAYKDPEAREGLRTGLVTRPWARHHHALWEAEQTDTQGR